MAERWIIPVKNQAAIYAAMLAFPRAMAKAGTRDAVAVNQAMRATPVNLFGTPVTLRGDGRLMTPVTTYRVKTPAQSKGPFDFCAPIGHLTPEQAFLPVAPACH